MACISAVASASLQWSRHTLQPCPLPAACRFDLKLYQIKLGTLEQAHAESEYVLRSYARNTKKAKLADKEDDA
jgi:hypothetical protein